MENIQFFYVICTYIISFIYCLEKFNLAKVDKQLVFHLFFANFITFKLVFTFVCLYFDPDYEISG
jgi:hypothetical protein